jgi:hypothetical protein
VRDILNALAFVIAVAAIFFAYLRGRKEGYDEASRVLPSREEVEKLNEELAKHQKLALERWKEEKGQQHETK